jgi:A/G-specific adenine glycosylase
MTARLLAWYDEYARALPWRVGPAERRADILPDPYRVWLSEIMLQQTTVATVSRRFEEFLARWPTVHALAASTLEDVLSAWAGLGYYARARNLHKCAVAIVRDHGGEFPSTEEELIRLPGVGGYTAAAIAAIAFDAPGAVVDGNVERVMARLFAIETPLPAARPALREAAVAVWPKERSGDFAQALMDLGAGICTPRSPNCAACPIAFACAAYAAGAAEDYPRRAAKKAKPTRRGAAFVLTRADGAILLRRRPAKGLLGGMLEVASSPWEDEAPADPLAHAPAPAKWARAGAKVRHTFTHFHLELDVWRARLDAREALKVDGLWTLDAASAGLPTVMRKVILAAGGEEGRG